jgi:hypothetical protein
MNLFIFGIANGFPVQAFNMSSKIQVFSFNFPRPIFADIMFVFRQIPFICSPVVRKIHGNGNQRKEGKRLQENIVCYFFTLPASSSIPDLRWREAFTLFDPKL